MQLLHGRYEILEIIKSGGMGSVYEAKDTKLADSPCAVKEILEDKQNVLYFQTRFEAEMKMLAELDHPAIPRVRDFFRLRGKHYLVMDLVRGQSLADELKEKGPLAPDQVASDMLELLDVLDYLHGHNPPMIHRDIKPSNILRDRRSGQIKLVDFGLARAACGAAQTAVGTMGYCAPEQSVGRADPRSDLYSVGVTMLQLLTGKDPDMLNPNAQYQQVPNGLRQITTRATRLKANERYASAKEMIKDLKLFQRGLGAAAGRTVPVQPTQPEVIYVQAQGNPLQNTLIAAAIVLALGLGALLGQAKAPTTQPSATPVLSQKVAPPTQFSAARPVAQPVAAPPPRTPSVPPYTPPPPPPRPIARRPQPAPVAEIRPSLGGVAYPTFRPSRPRPLEAPQSFEQPQLEPVQDFPTYQPEPPTDRPGILGKRPRHRF